jgi:hypothetical protein
MQSYTWEIFMDADQTVEVDIQAIYWSPWHAAQRSQNKTDVATMQGQATTLQTLTSLGSMAIISCYITKLCGK